MAATLPPPLNELLEAWNAWDVERAVRLVHPDVEIRGLRAALISHQIARDVEKELEYPGQIRVTVIRESRAVDFAK